MVFQMTKSLRKLTKIRGAEQPIMSCVYSMEQLKEQMMFLEFIDSEASHVQKLSAALLVACDKIDELEEKIRVLSGNKP